MRNSGLLVEEQAIGILSNLNYSRSKPKASSLYHLQSSLTQAARCR